MIARTYDESKIRAILRDKDAMTFASVDDVDFETCDLLVYDLCYLLSDAGLYMFKYMSLYLAEVHVCLYPEFRGKALTHSLEAVNWAFSNMGVVRIMAFIPVTNERARKHAIKVGFKTEGYVPKSVKQGGVLVDQHMLGLGGQ